MPTTDYTTDAQDMLGEVVIKPAKTFLTGKIGGSVPIRRGGGQV